MNCEQACTCIKPFIEGKIDDASLESFLNHMDHCSACYEELDIMYIVENGLDGLNANSGSFDFTGMLSSKMKESRRYLRLQKRRAMLKNSVVFGAYIALLIVVFNFFM